MNAIYILKGEFLVDPIWGQLILQIVLIAINAFFAAAEIAVLNLD